ncbi:MAG: hypothetical protein LBN97_06930, partial [Oscillospiraceae bacterium]|nr:hypothetical protein [Oscillospiraceae bacterium]
MQSRKISLILYLVGIAGIAMAVTLVLSGDFSKRTQGLELLGLLIGAVSIAIGLFIEYRRKHSEKLAKKELEQTDERGQSIDDKAGNYALVITHGFCVAAMIVFSALQNFTAVWICSGFVAVSGIVKLLLRRYYR